MDYATRMAMRAIVSGLRYSQRINDADCKAIVEAIDEAGTKAAERSRQAAGEIDLLGAEVALDCFSATHPLYLAAKRKAEED